ncbi:MAG: S-layer homology domain-containing protein [Bacillota bacterium]|nr:S-layer homology domain-containing protein [Bacillota bacterium]
MKKRFSFVIVLMLISSVITASASPPLANTFYGFQPTGEAYFAKSYFYIELDRQFEGAGENTCWNLSNIPSDGFMRVAAHVNGSRVLSNMRYKVDPVDMKPYENENSEATVFVNIDGQIGDSVCGKDRVVHVYYPENKSTAGKNITVDLTELGGYIEPEDKGIFYLSNKVSDFDEQYMKLDGSCNTEAVEKSMKNETIDFSKDTYLYMKVIHGCEIYMDKWVIKLERVPETTKRKVEIVPSSAVFDKRSLYSSNIYANFINNKGQMPDKIVLGDKDITQGNQFNDLELSKDLFKDFKAGDKTKITAFFGDDSCSMDIDIIDTTDSAYRQCFDDVDKFGKWEFINRLHDMNVVYGDENGFFRPGSNVTQAEFYVMLARTCGADISGGSNWYQSAFDWAKKYGIAESCDQSGAMTYKDAETVLLRVLFNYTLKGYDSREIELEDDSNGIFINNVGEANSYISDGKIDTLFRFFPIISQSNLNMNTCMSRQECAEAMVRLANLIKII